MDHQCHRRVLRNEDGRRGAGRGAVVGNGGRGGMERGRESDSDFRKTDLVAV